MIYHFDHAVPRNEHNFVAPEPEFTLTELKAIFNKWDAAIGNNGWNTVYFGNHDNPRVLSRFGNTDGFWKESAKMIATLLLTLRGTPYLYQGDEIGMSNSEFKSIEEFEDVQVRNAYQTLIIEQKKEEKDFLTASNRIARDHARTPMQWSAKPNAGFSSAENTWLKVNENYKTVNADSQEKDPNSVLNYYRNLIQLRKKTAALITGTYEDLLPESETVWVYKRSVSKLNYLIINNFTAKSEEFSSELLNDDATFVFGNYESENPLLGTTLFLRPYESVIYKIIG
ncbi:MAG: oligo-1,6-glucosidase [Spirosomataceae bacterium]|jgi:oligo-1,6-glucosidase